MDVKKFLDEISVPEGFTKTLYDEKSERWTDAGYEPVLYPSLRLEKGQEIEIKLIIEAPEAKYCVGAGHTSFQTKLGRRTFDRRGVNDSFYVDEGDDVQTVDKKIADQLKRVAESVEKMERSIEVPSLGFTVTPELLEEIKAKLGKGKEHTFRPAGFGTGYVLSKKRSRWAEKAKPEVNAFFGVGTLYMQRIDCD